MDVYALASDGSYVPHMSPHWQAPSRTHDTWKMDTHILCLKKKDWHQQEPKVQVPIMCKTYTVLPSTFWSTILNILFNSIWTIIKLSTWISNSVMQITGLVVKHDDFCLNYISSHKKSVYQCDWHKLVHLHLSQPNHSPLVKRIIRICCGHTMWYTAFWVWLNGDIDLLD